MTPRTLAIIPARYASTRFEGKPLAKLGGVSIIERVYRRVAGAVTDVVVATDNERIRAAVEAFGGRVVMTSTTHRCGTDRCAEALDTVGGDYDIVVNVQGDEPFIRREQIEALVGCFAAEDVEIATLARPFRRDEGMAAVESPNNVKVVRDALGRALYFSRAVIPFIRDHERGAWLEHHNYLKHVGIYAFRGDVLRRVTRLEAGKLEGAEMLEQLRWLEHGYRIAVAVTDDESIGIDTPEDLARAEALLESNSENRL
ncbi:MAG: 3-deoxy-manno-octulosonate cytidylyltransferase [Alistipes sp.]|nr:3-deoxy-manno-octulosonate cytidylyltransferase [Alistipes sp.]